MSVILNRLYQSIKVYPSGNYLDVSDYKFATRLDYDSNDNLVYVGLAHVGSSNSQNCWQIAKLYYNSNNDISGMRFANGDKLFDNVWDNRTSLTYT